MTSEEYNIRPTRIKLKETESDKAARLYRREQKRQQKLDERISRANEGASGSKSVTPPRFDQTSRSQAPVGTAANPVVIDDEDDEDDAEFTFEEAEGSGSQGRGGNGRWMGNGRRDVFEELSRGEEHDHINYHFQEELHRGDSFSFHFGFASGVPGPSIPLSPNIPNRYRNNGTTFTFSSTTTNTITAFPPDFHGGLRTGYGNGNGNGKGKGRRRDPIEEVHLRGGPIPSIGDMDEFEYTTWIRQGMERLRHLDDERERQRRAREREDVEYQRIIEEETREQEERRKEKRERRKLEREIKEQQRKLEDESVMRLVREREKYRERWKALVDVGGDVEFLNLRFGDIPWPVYRSRDKLLDIDTLDITAVGEFLTGLASDEKDQDKTIALKRVLREAIRAFHPDRFFGRILPRVKESDQEKVKEGVERCSRIINDLASRQ